MPTLKGAYDEETTSSKALTCVYIKDALAAVKGEHTMTELAQRFDVHPETNFAMENLASRASYGCDCSWRLYSSAARGVEGPSRQDWRVDVGK